MDKTKLILDTLHKYRDGYISGEELAGRLSVSRTSIWNHIDYLRGQGYVVEAHPRLGYRLIDIPDRLFPDEIQRNLKTRIIGKRVLVYEKTASSNDIAWDLAIKGEPEGTAVFAESQTDGRGRMGRRWYSPKHKGLWFSVILRPQLQPLYAPMITITSGIAVARAIAKLTGLSTGIKWPNDIYINDKKTSGILTEASTELDRIKFVILGIGINTNFKPEDFPAALKDKAASIMCSRIELAKEVLMSLEFYYNMMNGKRWDVIIDEWKAMSVVLGRRIRLAQGDKEYEGQALGIDEYGSLILRQDDGFIEHLCSGDILCF